MPGGEITPDKRVALGQVAPGVVLCFTGIAYYGFTQNAPPVTSQRFARAAAETQQGSAVTSA